MQASTTALGCERRPNAISDHFTEKNKSVTNYHYLVELSLVIIYRQFNQFFNSLNSDNLIQVIHEGYNK